MDGGAQEVVLRLLRDEPVQLLSRQLGVEIFRLEQWREKAIGGIDASLKQRKGDPVQAELDSAMKRIGELTMQVELLEAIRPFGAVEVAATSPGTGLAYGLRRVCAAWGPAPRYAMTSVLAKRRGPKPAISDQALLVAIDGGIALGGRGLPQGLGSASGLSRHPGCPQAGAPPDAREQSALAPSLPPPWRQSP